jgi:hypothetical protein
MNIRLYNFEKQVLNHFTKYNSSINSDLIANAYINRHFRKIIKKYAAIPADVYQDISPADRYAGLPPVFICWWQGYDTAPVLVKKCIDSTRKHAGKHPVILITADTWQQYAHIPQNIINKVESGAISLTHFSDILRMCLVSEHGGLWLDATIFTAQDIPEEYFTSPFYTIRYPGSASRITKGRWTGFCMGACCGSVLHSFCRDIFFSYWKKNNVLFEYFFIDYVIFCAYSKIPVIHNMIDSVPENCTGVKELEMHFNDAYSPEMYALLLEKSVFFKLNWKRHYLDNTEDGKETLYLYFIKSNCI